MRTFTLASAVLAVGMPFGSIAGVAASRIAPDLRAVARRAAAAPIPFLENDGQLDARGVRYYARLASGTLFVTADGGMVYSLPAGCRGRLAFRESFVGGNTNAPAGAEPSAIRVSQFKGSRADWRPRLRTFDRVDLGEVYPGIRVSLRAAGSNVEKLLHVAPGAKATAIRIAVEGARSLALDADRRLELRTDGGEVFFTAPVAYQTIGGRRQAVDVAYTVSESTYGFELGAHRKDHEVIIDPLLASTYIGGHNPSPPGNYDDDVVEAMVASGDTIYLAGATQSPDFPIEMGYDDTIGGNFPDGFVTQMTGDLSTVIASTFVGTQYSDRVDAMAIDGAGRIVIAGQAGYGFPVTDGAYTWSGTTPTGGGFVAKLSADLSTLLGSAIPTPSDYPRRLALGNGGIYFGGTTNNPSFPITPGAYKSTCCPPGGYGIRPYEGFAGKISDDLTTLESMTYLGGQTVSGLAVAPDGKLFLTDGSDNAITGYIARFDPGLTSREAYLSYYPGSTSGSSRTYFNDLAVGAGYVVTAGQTYMNDLPATAGAYDTTCGTDGACDGVGDLLVPRSDGFVAKYGLDLQTTEALTYLGGSDHESIRALALNPDGSVIVAGETTSVDFPTSGDASDRDCGTDGRCNPTGTYDTPTADGFVARLSSDLSRLQYGSYLGGSDADRPRAVALDGLGDVFVGGNTVSSDFPTTPGAFDRSYNGGTSDAFVSKVGTTAGEGGASSAPGETCANGMTQMVVQSFDPSDSMLSVTFASGCDSVDNNVYYGPLQDVSRYGYSGQVCHVGVGGTTSFPLLGGSYFFLIAADDGSVEGSYGQDSRRFERPASRACGFRQDLSSPCSGP